jgi:hypothetical protein
MHCCLQSRLQQEQERCLHYLEPSSRRPLLQAVEQQLLAAHTPQILAKVGAASGSGNGGSSNRSSSWVRGCVFADWHGTLTLSAMQHAAVMPRTVAAPCGRALWLPQRFVVVSVCFVIHYHAARPAGFSADVLTAVCQ